MSSINPTLIRKALQELSSAEIQRAIWLPNTPGQMSSYTEAIECLFTDSGLNLALAKNEIASAEVLQILRELDHATSSFDRSRGPAEIIADPQFVIISGLCSKLLLKFDEYFNN